MRIGGLIFLFLTWCNTVEASPLRLSIGASIIKANINDPKYKYINQNEIIPSFNIGLSKSFNNIVLSIQTNRLINHAISRSVTSENGIVYQNKSKITNDTVLFGYRIERFIPSMLVSNVKLNKSLWYRGNYIAKQTNHTIIYGMNFGYMLTENINANLFFIAPNRELNLKNTTGINLTYLF